MPKIKEMSLPDELATMGDAYEAEGRPLDKCDVEILLKAAAELRELSTIVRALAEKEPLVEDTECDTDSCGICGAPRLFGGGIEHRDDCPYRRAVEWCAQHEEGK